MPTPKSTTKRRRVKTKLKTRIAIILDRSGSMGSIRKEAVDVFNEQIKTIRAKSKGMDTRVTLTTFSTVADDPKIFNESASSLKPLRYHDYVCEGMTAMYDAVGTTIDRLMALPEYTDPECSFLVIVISDGEENNSKLFTVNQIAEKIQLVQATKRWTVSYMGANQDLAKISQQLNISIGNTAQWTTSQAGMRGMSASNTSALDTYMNVRSTGVGQVSGFYSDSTSTGPVITDIPPKKKQ